MTYRYRAVNSSRDAVLQREMQQMQTQLDNMRKCLKIMQNLFAPPQNLSARTMASITQGQQ